ncbi:MAG TPA: AAA family ATPase, partial [Mycobacterium sp.]|nr:AAA family ATPase [Mycobacterium sp.]
MVAGDWQPHVPAATIGRPGTPNAVVGRPALVKSLLDARGGDLVMVSAPAGYGKTTAVALWDDADERPFTWVRLDHLDDDPAHLLLHIATAVAEVHQIDPGVLSYLRGPGRAALTQLVPALVQVLESCGPVVVVLDDTHELATAEAVETLRALVDVLPAATTMVLVGRCAPPLDLARRRLQHRVLEIGITELKLSADEASAVFAAVGGPSDDATAQTVIDTCEGWAAGVLLAAVALRDGAPADKLTGCHHLVAGYLLEEVLGQLDAATTTFLLESAIFERFCAAQLDEVLERDDSAKMLATIMASGNFFLVSLDAERIWHRYHRLFGDLLRARLRGRDPARFKDLAARAADVLERQGDTDGAVLQALAAEDRARAAELVGRDAVKLGFDGRAGVLARRVGLLDERTFAGYPDAAIARAWLGVTTGDAALIQSSLVMASRADRDLPLADGTSSVSVAAALVGSLVGVGGVREIVRHADTVRAAGDHTVNAWWGAATVMKGAAMSMLGKTAASRVLLESALPVVEDLPGFHAAALAHLALLDIGDDDDLAARERSSAARRIADTF